MIYRKCSFVCIMIFLAVLPGGCADPLRFSASPAKGVSEGIVTHAYDTSGDGVSDFFLISNRIGRLATIGYDNTSDGQADELIPLDSISPQDRRHVVIILDGFAYEVIDKYRQDGHLGMFFPPSKVVAPYPTLTDLGLADALAAKTCPAFEAEYFDRKANRVVGGSMAYLNGMNSTFEKHVDHRADALWDAISYIYPWQVFKREVGQIARSTSPPLEKDFTAYIVSTAGMSTEQGEAGQIRCLERIERLVLQLIHESRGRVSITLLADHGHSYTPGVRLGLDKHLKDYGWRVASSLERDRDVVLTPFGILTAAWAWTDSPAELADDVRMLQGVKIVSYVDGDKVIVLAPGGQRAEITHKGGRFSYKSINGDPLQLAGILKTLKSDSQGFYDARALLTATVDHIFPAPLSRLWRGHHNSVTNTPDVIISLEDAYYTGSKSFESYAKIASTHGGLNRKNSVTFIMSTAGPLSPIMRSEDIPAAMTNLTGRPFPFKLGTVPYLNRNTAN